MIFNYDFLTFFFVILFGHSPQTRSKSDLMRDSQVANRKKSELKEENALLLAKLKRSY